VINLARSLLSYNPDTGVITRIKTSGGAVAGSIAGWKNQMGYIELRISGKCQKAHRIAFLLMMGRFPLEIDHINGIKDDNRWENLREVTHRTNGRNQKHRTTNTSGLMGITWKKANQKWVVRTSDAHIGIFNDFFEAYCARKSAELTLNYHKNHGRSI
jgi:hypothetical protein